MTKSQRVKEGVFVTRRGNKYIRCARNRRPEGVWTNGYEQVVKTLNGDRVYVSSPAGVIISGFSRGGQ
jgi:hypothetical protein